MTLYLKYRPQTVDELDLEDVRNSLKKILSSGKIPHAFIFSGPKGVGKTSAARILAKVVNCENLLSSRKPCNSCEQCLSIAKGDNLDVIELDAASHRGIDDVRLLREKVKLASVKAKKKVYIIDEAHMLTAEASNALLKTLEEPPAHVIFILATTNPEKLIPTIRSRATEINFRKAKEEEIERCLKRVIKGEKIKVEEEALRIIAQASDGSFRDAVKLLEQLILEKVEISKKSVSEFIFGKVAFNIEEFLSILSKKDAIGALEKIEAAVEAGLTVKNIFTLLISRLRKGLLAKLGLPQEDVKYFSKEQLINLISLFEDASLKVDGSVIEQVPLEIAVVKWCTQKEDNYGQKQSLKGKVESDKAGRKEGLKTFSEEISKNKISQNAKGSLFNEEVWFKILASIKPRNPSTEALLRASKPLSYDGKILILGVYYRFHKEHLESDPHRRILEDTVQKVLGNFVKVRCVLTDPPKKAELTESELESSPNSSLTQDNDEDIITIAKEIFGS